MEKEEIIVRNEIMLNPEQIRIIKRAVEVLNEHGTSITKVVAVLYKFFYNNIFYLYTYREPYLEEDIEGNLKFLGHLYYLEKTGNIEVTKGENRYSSNTFIVLSSPSKSLISEVFDIPEYRIRSP